MATLEHPHEVMSDLRGAGRFLTSAHKYASETEDGRTGLIGPTRDLIFGLNSAVAALIELIEAAPKGA